MGTPPLSLWVLLLSLYGYSSSLFMGTSLDLCHCRTCIIVVESALLLNLCCCCWIRVVVVESMLSLSNPHHGCQICIVVVKSMLWLLWLNLCHPAFVVVTSQSVALLNSYYCTNMTISSGHGSQRPIKRRVLVNCRGHNFFWRVGQLLVENAKFLY